MSDLPAGRPTVRGAWAALVWIVLVTAVVVSGRATLWPVVVGLSVPLVVAPILSYRRVRRLPPGFDLHLRAMPPMVPLGAGCSLHLTPSWRGGPLPPMDLELPDRRWTRLDRLPTAGDMTAQAGLWRPAGPARSAGPTVLAGPTTPLEPTAPAAAERVSPIGRWAPGRPALLHLRTWSPGTSRLTEHAVPTGVRGIFVLPPLRIWVGDPFGLFAWAGPVQRPAAVVVHPRAVEIDHHLLPPPTPNQGGDEVLEPSHLPTAREGVGEMAGLRPYRVGDRLSRVHWPSLAGDSGITVRHFLPDGATVVRIVVDDRAGAHRRHSFDLALAVTAALVARSTAEGRAVDLVTLSGERVRVEPTPAGAAGILPLLASLHPRRLHDRLTVGHPRHAGSPGPDESMPWDVAGGFGSCTVVTTETGAPTLPAVITATGQIVAV